MRWSFLLLACFAFTTTGSADDWLRFRGPQGSGIAENATPPTEWSETDNLKWKRVLPGKGVSCPVIVGDRIFVTCYSGYGMSRENPGDQADLKRHLVCVNRNNGDIVWQKSFEPVLPEDAYSGMGVPEHGYASHTPVSDGERLYVFFGKSGAYAFDLDGEQLWHTSLGTESDNRLWGTSSSPIVYEDIVVVPAGPEGRAIVGLDAKTGEERWKAEAEGLGMVWGTPFLSKVNDDRTDIIIGAPYEIWGLNPESGKLRWFAEVMETESFSSSVVQSDDVYVAIEGRSGGSVGVKAGGKGDVTEANTLWSGRDKNRFATPLAYEGRIYFIADGLVNCMDAKTGDKIFRERLPEGPKPAGRPSDGGGRFRSTDYASPVLADGRIYFQKRSGECHLFEATDAFSHLGAYRVSPDPDEQFSATPAIAGSDLVVRSDKALYCISAD